MPPFQPSEKELLKSVLEPLLEDFDYWFARSRSLLESEEIGFLSDSEQKNLLAGVQQAQQEVHTAQMLLSATNGQAGVDTDTLFHWHSLVTECWQVSRRWRSLTCHFPKKGISVRQGDTQD